MLHLFKKTTLRLWSVWSLTGRWCVVVSLGYLEVGLEAVRGGGAAARARPGGLLAHHAEVHAVQVRQHLPTEKRRVLKTSQQ